MTFSFSNVIVFENFSSDPKNITQSDLYKNNSEERENESEKIPLIHPRRIIGTCQ